MKKYKKFIYPFIFSICFFITYIILTIIFNEVLPSGDFAALAYAFIALILWMLIVVPIYCVKYSKIIQNEKKNYLFAVYNSLVISVSYTGPFFILNRSSSVAVVLISITIAIFVWIAICTFTPLLVSLNTTKKQDENKR